MAIMGGIVSYGWYKLFHGQREKIEYAREKAWARIHLTAVMQAEEDRDQARRYFADQAREKELLGGNTKVYNSDRYVPFFFAGRLSGRAGWWAMDEALECVRGDLDLG